jgi:hypothetical protein
MHDSYNTHRMLGYGVENVEHPRLLEKHDEPDCCECKRNVPWRQRSTRGGEYMGLCVRSSVVQLQLVNQR